MSASNWSVRDKVVAGSFFLFAGIVFVCAIFAVGYSKGTHRAEAQNYAAEYPHDTQKRLNECPVDTTVAFVECAEEIISSSREEQRSEHDLNAQRDMAKWAWWLLAVSVATLVVSSVGLWALLRTIKQGEDGLKRAHDANLIAQQSHRAWIKIHAPDKMSMHIHSAKGRLYYWTDLRVSCENFGEAPAIALLTRAVLCASGDIENMERLIESVSGYSEQQSGWQGGAHVMSTLFPKDRTDPFTVPVRSKRDIFPPTVQAFEAQGELILAVVAIYKSSGTGMIHRTPAFFRFHQPHQMFDDCDIMEYLQGDHIIRIHRCNISGYEPN